MNGPHVEPETDRLFDTERYSPVTVEAMLRLQNGPARSFMVAAAIGSYLREEGSSERLRSGREAVGSLIGPRRLPKVLEALDMTERNWRRLVKDWQARYLAHRCGPGRVVLFTRPLLMECPSCHAEMPAIREAPSPVSGRGATRDERGRWCAAEPGRNVSAETDGTLPENGRNVSKRLDGTRPQSGTDAPHQAIRSLQGDEVGLRVEVPDPEGFLEGLS